MPYLYLNSCKVLLIPQVLLNYGGLQNATLRGNRACRTPKRVVKCKCVLGASNPLRRSACQDTQMCREVQMCLGCEQPSAEILCREMQMCLGCEQPSAKILRAGTPKCVVKCKCVLGASNPLRRSCVPGRPNVS